VTYQDKVGVNTKVKDYYSHYHHNYYNYCNHYIHLDYTMLCHQKMEKVEDQDKETKQGNLYS